MPILGYQIQQWRVVPYRCAAIVMNYYLRSLVKEFISFSISSTIEDKSPALADQGVELHITACAAKASLLVRDAIQEAREACGGHRFLRASGFGAIKDHDGKCTYEGDNVFFSKLAMYC